MRRAAYWAPFVGLMAVIAVYAWSEGQKAANLTESDVIEAMAARYLASAGPDARRTDCVARPSSENWLVVTCSRDNQDWRYEVSRLGVLVKETVPRAPIFGEDSI